MANLENSNDNQAVELAKASPEAFAEIIDRYERRLFSFIRRISYFTNEDIEDILQETFIKVYKNLNDFDNSMKFSTWIYQIARNTVIDEIRKKHSRPQNSNLEEEDLIKILKSNIDISKEMETKEKLAAVKKIINMLPYKYKEVMILRFLEEKSYEEIMDIVRKPKGTVAALVNRARNMIRGELNKKIF